MALGSVLVMLVLPCMAMTGAVSEEGSVCAHEWEHYSETRHGAAPVSIILEEATPEYHLYMRETPEAICRLCGAWSESCTRSGSYVPHAYTVQEWEYINDKMDVKFVMLCGVCGYRYEDTVETELICSGEAGSCLFGGICDQRKRAALYSSGLVLPAGDEAYPSEFAAGDKELLYALVYDPSAGTFQPGYRVFCPACGKPRLQSDVAASERFEESWNGLPAMTPDYMLTVGVPEGLPYQMIEQIRNDMNGG